MAMASNVYELHARWNKAVQLAAHLSAYDFPSSRLGEISTETWRGLAESIKVNPPSVECREIVKSILVTLETAKAQMIAAIDTPVDIKEVAK